MVQQLINTLVQSVVFMLIPVLVYLIGKRKLKGFLPWMGLKASPLKANLLGLALMLLLAVPILVFAGLNQEIRDILSHPDTVPGMLREMGVGAGAIGILILVAGVKTSLLEELFFRGFLAKRLIAWLGFGWGNALQAVIFGAVHVLLFLSMTSHVPFLTMSFLVPTAGAWAKAYLNEKLAEGSIIPGWIAHGTANLLAYSVLAFGW